MKTDVINRDINRIMAEVGAKPSEMALGQEVREWLLGAACDPKVDISALLDGDRLEPSLRQTLLDYLECKVGHSRAMAMRRAIGTK